MDSIRTRIDVSPLAAGFGAAQHIEGGASRATVEVRRGRIDRDSSPCPTRRRNRGRTSPCASSVAYTSASARSSECDPKTRSTRLAVHLSSPLTRQRPSNDSRASDVGFHSVPMSRRCTKKSLVNVPGRFVNTPCFDCPVFASSARRPPTSTVISGALSVSRKARSISRCSAGTGALSDEVAESVGVRFEHGERFHVSPFLRRVGASRLERNLRRRARRPWRPSPRLHIRPARSGRQARPSSCRPSARC